MTIIVGSSPKRVPAPGVLSDVSGTIGVEFAGINATDCSNTDTAAASSCVLVYFNHKIRKYCEPLVLIWTFGGHMVDISSYFVNIKNKVMLLAFPLAQKKE